MPQGRKGTRQRPWIQQSTDGAGTACGMLYEPRGTSSHTAYPVSAAIRTACQLETAGEARQSPPAKAQRGREGRRNGWEKEAERA